MRAAVLEEFGADLNVTEVPDPEPGPGEVLVRTRASGLCRTDLKIIDGGIPAVQPPLVLGHELAGEVAVLGPGVTSASVGDRVLVGLDVSCGRCAYCRIGELDHCDALQRLGLERDGSLGELVRVPAANLVDLPDHVDFASAASIADAIGTPYHAVMTRAALRPAEVVAVYGLGGLGLSAVQIAVAAGARVIAIARTPARRDLAIELGADHAIDPRDAPLSEQLRDLTGGLGVHVFLDVVGIEGSTAEAVRSCRRGGRVVVLGYVASELVAPMVDVVIREVSIAGSRSSTRADLRAALDLVAAGRVRAIIGERVGLDEVNEALARLRAGETIGRAVVDFP